MGFMGLIGLKRFTRLKGVLEGFKTVNGKSHTDIVSPVEP